MPAKQNAEPLPEHLDPMLATLGTLPPSAKDEQWAYEMKWDGVRSITRIDAGRVGLRSRNDRDMSVAYPELAGLGTALGDSQVLLDGEIVTFDAHGRPSFSRLQKRMHVANAGDAKRLARTDPVILLIFDVLHLNGRSLLKLPYSERRSILEGLELTGDAWATPAVFAGNGPDAVRVSQEQKLEGVVAKRLTSTYVPGRRSPDWVKVKNVRTQEVVVGGWHPGSGRREGAIGSLLLGIPDGDALAYVGKVGTGFTDSMLTELGKELKKTSESPFKDIPRVDARDAHWVRPELVGEVAFAEWTPDGRLRHPAWRGIRDDKRVDQVVRES